MPRPRPEPHEVLIDDLVAHYVANLDDIELALYQLRGHLEKDKKLGSHVHSFKWRIKSPSSLRDKLLRKWKRSQESGMNFIYTKENLFSEVNDLAGFRILHLYTRQVDAINRALVERLDEARYKIIEGPEARSWDDETRSYFESIGMESVTSETLYTSIHYVIETFSRTKYTCEIQVRTLAEELWGETDHTINYPHPTNSIACKEQILVLAKVVGACSRLVDSIFRSHHDHEISQKKARRPKKTSALPE